MRESKDKGLPRTGYFETLHLLISDPDLLIKKTLQSVLEHDYQMEAPSSEMKEIQMAKTWTRKRRAWYFFYAMFKPGKFHSYWETEIKKICLDQLVIGDIQEYFKRLKEPKEPEDESR